MDGLVLGELRLIMLQSQRLQLPIKPLRPCKNRQHPQHHVHSERPINSNFSSLCKNVVTPYADMISYFIFTVSIRHVVIFQRITQQPWIAMYSNFMMLSIFSMILSILIRTTIVDCTHVHIIRFVFDKKKHCKKKMVLICFCYDNILR